MAEVNTKKAPKKKAPPTHPPAASAALRLSAGAGPGAGAGGMCSCLSIAYYRPFFDVDTDEVLGRVRAALLFCHSEPFIRVLRNKPDAYGPWWIATTLIFLISVTSHFKALLSLGDDY